MNPLITLKSFFSTKKKLKFSICLFGVTLLLLYISIFKLSIPNTKALQFQWEKQVTKPTLTEESKSTCLKNLNEFLKNINIKENNRVHFSKKELYYLYNTRPYFKKWIGHIKINLDTTKTNYIDLNRKAELNLGETNLNIYYKLNLRDLPILKYVPYLRNRSFYGKLETKPTISNKNIALILRRVYWNNDDFPTSLFGNIYQFKSTSKLFKNIKSIRLDPLGIEITSL